MYVLRDTVARSHNVCSSSDIVTVSWHFTRSECLYCKISVAGSNEIYFDIHVECLNVLPDLKQILIFLTYFHRSPEYEKFKENCADTCGDTDIKQIDGRTDGNREVNRQFQRLCEHTYKL